MEVAIEPGWKSVLAPEFEKPYFQELAARLHAEKRAGKTIYPPGRQIFRAFELTPFDQVKVVILGQDPYHNPGQAEGLSFSVPHGVPAPPSLKNIYKEIETDLGVVIRKDGSLESWARQGVFLLNAILTVEAGRAASHAGFGWATFTDAVIRTLSERRDGLVFLLWGNFARSKKALIDPSRHTVLEAAHPSPLAGGAFFGCRHFSKANAALLAQGLQPIDWTL
ncbi:MAG: uracil-DNA glycosylase [Bacteroidales bacterium]|nr:uracil-DNA glycosylase [Bacteroidales bacterium]